MKTPLFICPFSKQIINDKNSIASYLRWTSRDKNISIQELRFLVYKETFGEVCNYDIFYDYYINKQYSLPIFLKNYFLSYRITEFLIGYHNIPKRGLKEANKIGAQRSKQTNIERYGVDQTFKVQEFNNKRKKTYQERYGVDNPFKVKNFLEKIEETYQNKYGCSPREYRSIKGKEIWNSRSLEEKEYYKNISINSPKCQNNNKNNKSKLELRIIKILMDNQIQHIVQFKIKPYFFDICLSDINILIEINGTIWHADPLLYKEDDILPVTGKKAKEIWEKDKKKLDIAKRKGYRVITIWEREFKFLSDKQLLALIYEKIKNKIYPKD